MDKMRDKMRDKTHALPPEELYRASDPALLDFSTTADLPDFNDSFGQKRAVDAVRFGVGIDQPGYNLFVLGESGSGRHAIVRMLLDETATGGGSPPDWCYVHNFQDAARPVAMQLPAGRGRQLRDDMHAFVSELGGAVSDVFEGERYHARIEAIQEEYKKRENQALMELGDAAVGDGIALLRTPQGFAFSPVKGEEAMSPDEFAKLPDEERERISRKMQEYHERLHKLLRQFPHWRRKMQEEVKTASQEALSDAVSHMIEELKQKYADLPRVLAFLDAVYADILESGENLHEQRHTEDDADVVQMSGTLTPQRYLVNLVVDHGESHGAPVVCEDNPNFQNLVGRIDQIAHMGTLVTNFTLIRGGALHAANGGYLVLDAIKLLSHPYAWEGLKRALRAGEIKIESLGQIYGFVTTIQLEPQPVPLKLKVVLIGERFLYYLLNELDPDFDELFKVAADFEHEVERNPDNVRFYASLLATLARASGLRPIERDAVARVIDHGARLAEDAERLSMNTRRLSDLLREADYWAGKEKHEAVTRADVERALDEQTRRVDRVRTAYQKEILRDTLIIDTAGALVGQINGLAAIDLGNFVFAHPVKITATARLGEGDVINVEREAELSGPIHSKGVMILSAFIASRYSRSMPLSLHATLAFEQSYGSVEGDSASLAELCAIMSALSRLPIRQTLAVTGSVNQYGRVQAIGAVNDKIEGFFDICKARGLDGKQGVLIPQANVKHLMLRDDVVQAVREGRFGIYAVSDVDEAIGLLTGVEAGEPDEQGLVPEGTVNYLVAQELLEMSMLRQDFAAEGREKGKKKEKGKGGEETPGEPGLPQPDGGGKDSP